MARCSLLPPPPVGSMRTVEIIYLLAGLTAGDGILFLGQMAVGYGIMRLDNFVAFPIFDTTFSRFLSQLIKSICIFALYLP